MTPDDKTAAAAHSRRSRRAALAAQAHPEQSATDVVAAPDEGSAVGEVVDAPLSRRERRRRETVTSVVPAPESDGAEFGAPPRVPEGTPDDAPADVDAFAAAAAALEFTGEQARVTTRETDARPQPARRERAQHPRRQHTPFRRFAAATASACAVVTATLIAVGTTMPFFGGGAEAAESEAQVQAQTAEVAVPDSVEDQLQAYVSGGGAESEPLVRVEGYEATTFSEMAEADGISTSGAFFENDPTADIQWPFAVGTSMSSPYGWRWGRMHEGVDFTPGDGAPVQAVADGVVRVASEAGGAYGVNVYIDHVIDGQLVSTHYAHMQYGSLRVVSGQRVEVGDVVGLTGNTGRSYGAHLHFEVIVGGSAIDPLPWLEEHANTHYSDDEEAAVAAQAASLGLDLSDEG